METRGGAKRPQLSDLRESGAIEQDADIVMFIHRPDYYGMTEDPSQAGLTEIIIAKHRNGSVCDVQMKFRNSEVRFVDITDPAMDMPAPASHAEYGSSMNAPEDDGFGGAGFGGGNEFAGNEFENTDF